MSICKNTENADMPTAPAPIDTQQMTIFAALGLLFRHLSPGRRKAVIPLMFLMLIGAIAELFTLGALLPFLAVISAPENSPAIETVKPILNLIGAQTPHQETFTLAGLFAATVLAATLLRLILLRKTQSFVYGLSYELGVELYANTLAQPYSYHTQTNTSEIIASVNKVELITGGILMPLMNAGVAIVIAAFIITGLVIIDPIVALASGCGFITIYLLATLTTRTQLVRNGAIIAKAQQSRVHSLQEGLGGIRDVLIDRSQKVFIETYERAEAGFRDARSRNALLANAPRFVVEGTGMVLIVLIAASLTLRQGGFAAAIPVLGTLALGAQRLLPLIQQVFLGWASSVGNKQLLLDVVSLLNRPRPNLIEPDKPLAFSKSIVLSGISHSYSGSRVPAVSDVNFEIPKGSRIGLAGKTGSGKSTLIDIVIGLLEPTNGEMRVDGILVAPANRLAWQKNIAHVPQNIFLADASVTANIAFGVKAEKIDLERVRQVADQAKLSAVIAALPNGFETRVGERGIQLSGGQRQRIGIARALYKQSSVLVLDEATSALDQETETEVMEAIERLDRDLTIIMIAHRLSTLDGCDKILRLEGGRVVSQESRAS